MKSFILIALMLVPMASIAQAPSETVGASATVEDRNGRGRGEPPAAGGLPNPEGVEAREPCSGCGPEGRRTSPAMSNRGAALAPATPPVTGPSTPPPGQPTNPTGAVE